MCACAKLAAICRCGLTVSVGQGETTPSLLAMLLVVQPWMLPAISAAWAHCWLLPSSLPSGPPGPFPQSCSPAHQPVSLQGFIPSQLQDFALVFAEFHEVPVGPFLQPVKGSPTLQHICCSPPSLTSSANLIGMQYQNPEEVSVGNYLHLSSSTVSSHFASP